MGSLASDRLPNNSNARHLRGHLLQQLQPFPADAEFEGSKAGHVAARTRPGDAVRPFGLKVDRRSTAGVAEKRTTDANTEMIVKRADLAMYAAKAAGRNRTCTAP
jgi:GGDEF domain-containing protein